MLAAVASAAALEHGRARDQHIGAGLHHARRGLRRDAAVDLDVDRRGRRPARARRGDLVERGRNEGLAAEAGIDRHDEDQIDDVDDMLDRCYRRAGIERDAGLLAERADRLQRAVRDAGPPRHAR